MWHQVSSWVQESISLVPIHQGVQLRWVRTALYTASPDTPKQYVHANANGYHYCDGLRLSWRQRCCWWWLWKKALSVGQKEKLHHIPPHRDHWVERRQCEGAEWSSFKHSARGVLLKGVKNRHMYVRNVYTAWYTAHTNTVQIFDKCRLKLESRQELYRKYLRISVSG